MIEDAVMAPPEALGFPGASSIRNCRVSLPTGRVDVVLLPSARPVRLVLVEARAATSQDAASKVVGQFLMYYAGALMLGSKGLCALRRFAVDRPEQARSPLWISPRLLSGGISPPAKAFEAIYRGRRISPSEPQLFIVLDDEPHRALEPTLLALREYHGLQIGFVLVRDGTVSRVQAYSGLTAR